MTHGTGHVHSSTSHGHTHALTVSEHVVATQPSDCSVKRIAQGGATVEVIAGPRAGPQPARASVTPRKGSGTSKQAGHKVGENKKALVDECDDLQQPVGSQNEGDDYYDDMATGFLQFWYVHSRV